METRGWTSAHFLRKCRPSGQPTEVGVSYLFYSGAAAHLQPTLKGQRGQEILEEMEGIQEITLFILLTVGLFRPILLRAFDLPPGKRSPVKSHIPTGDLGCQEAFHGFWPICFSADFQHYGSSLGRPDVWLEIWDWTKEEKVGKSHGDVCMLTTTNGSERWERGQIPGREEHPEAKDSP